MDVHNKHLSVRFYNFLCSIIGNKQLVNKRRQIFDVRENCWQNSKKSNISSGSKAEGLDLKGSDYDEMSVHHDVEVFERLDQATNINKKITLIMDTENVPPGFTKLLTLHPQNQYFSEWIDSKTVFPYFSSSLYHTTIFDEIPDKTSFHIHGPCATLTITFPKTEIDFAFPLHCKKWISQASQWITRTKYSWASSEVIQNILNFGVLFVPIGSKNSVHSDLEWRISFSHAEKQLIFCFNHVQLLCYALLKIFLKDIIKKTFGDLLCSYFMKTIMFWLCEETELSNWKPENMLSCFMTCFRRLIYCVEKEHCLHYFIPENNLFQNRFLGDHINLLSTLQGLYNIGWTCLLQTETLQSFRSYLEPSLSSNILPSTFFPCLKYLDLGRGGVNRDDCVSIIPVLIYHVLRSTSARDFYIYEISQMFQELAQNNFNEKGNNKLLYKESRRRLSHLLIGVNSDAVSGWLLLASYFYTNKQYSLFKILIDHCLTKFTPDRCDLFWENGFRKLQRFTEIQNIIGRRCLKHYTIGDVTVCKNSDIIPDVKSHFEEHDTKVLLFPSLAYAHLLNYYFCCTVGDDRERRISHQNILLTSDYYKLKDILEELEVPI